MRIWHKKLIPHLCQKHLCATWRESLGAYKIITSSMDVSYAKHPATLEFSNSPYSLYVRLKDIRKEMLKRGYNPKPLPKLNLKKGKIKTWQTLSEQIIHLRSKNCECNLEDL